MYFFKQFENLYLGIFSFFLMSVIQDPLGMTAYIFSEIQDPLVVAPCVFSAIAGAFVFSVIQDSLVVAVFMFSFKLAYPLSVIINSTTEYLSVYLANCKNKI